MIETRDCPYFAIPTSTLVMPRSKVIQPDRSYSFSDYFKLNAAPRDVLAYFDVTLQRAKLELPRSPDPLERLEDLRGRIEESLPRLSLTSEMARREFLIAPVLMEVLHYSEARLDVEYPIAVSQQLRGSLDYLLQTDSALLVIEAKNEDLERGFVQLAVELIALETWLEGELEDTDYLYGAISTGNIWQFGRLDRRSRQITQDLNLYRVPTDLREVLQVLLGILGTR